MSNEPTSRANDVLIEELRDAIGDEAVERADLDVERAVQDSGRAKTPEASRSRLLFAVIGAAGIVVAAVAALALESWVVFGVALLLHAIGSAIVVTVAFRTTTDVEKPGPTTVAMLEDEGVDDPEGALNQLVEQASSRDDGDGTDQASSRADEVANEQDSLSPGTDRAA